MATAVNGEVSVTGFFSGTTSFGSTNISSSGAEDIFIARYDGGGNLLWVRKAGGTGYDEGRAVAVDAAGNTFVEGLFQGTATFGSTNLTSAGESDVFLAKYSPAGALLWVRRAGGTDFDEGNGLALDPAGVAYLTGSFNLKASCGSLTLTNHTASNQLFVAKCNAAGTFVWARRAGGTADAAGTAIALDGQSNVLVAGTFEGSFSIGATNLTSAGGADIFIAQLDPSGGWAWARQAGGAGNDEPAAIAAAAGKVIVAGKFSSPAQFGSTNVTGNGVDMFISQYDSAGGLQWVRRAGGNNSIYGDAALAVAIDPSGQRILAGFFSGTASFSGTNITSSGFQDIFVAAYRTNGDLGWVRKAGGANLDATTGVAIDGAGNILLTGFFSGTATFGAGALTSGAAGISRDIFVAKLAAPPPVLAILRLPQGIQLSWPAFASDYRLETSDSLTANSWTVVVAPSNIINSSRIVEWTNTSSHTFFRLNKQ